ncbi:MAG: CoA-binding protein, partial [Candidatus Binatia bacterium]
MIDGGSYEAIQNLLRPSSIAIVGASPKGQWASTIFRNLKEMVFPGKVFLVNPNYRELWGAPCYASIGDLPQKIDQALLLVRSELSGSVLREAAQQGAQSAIVYSSGFGETGPEGRARESELRQIAQEHGIRFCGPNCMGTISVREKTMTYPQAIVSGLLPGGLAVIFQSGGTLGSWIRSAGDRGLGLSYAVSSGNETDLDLVDYLNFFISDEHTRVIALFIEGIRRPGEFQQACAEALRQGKPILAVKVGRSERGQLSALTHTGVLAGSDDAFGALCRKFGVVRVRTLDDLLEGSEAFGRGRLPAGDGVGVVLSSGALKGLVLDLAEELGMSLPEPSAMTSERIKGLLPPGMPPGNPLDMGVAGFGDEENYMACSEIM